MSAPKGLGYNADMNISRGNRPAGRRTRTILVLVAASVGLAGLAVAGGYYGTLWRTRQALRSPDPAERAAAVRKLAGRRVTSAAEAIRRLITADPDAGVRNAAIDAAARLGDMAAAPVIKDVIATAPDAEPVSGWIVDYARLVGRAADSEAMVEQWSASHRAYVRIGAALARVEWGEAEGVDELLAIAPMLPADVQTVVRSKVRVIVGPVAEMIGMPLDLDGAWPDERYATVRAWWAAHGSDRRLADAMEPKRRWDLNAHRIDRLDRVKTRFGRMIGVYETP